MKTTSRILGLLFLGTALTGAEVDDMKAFPPAEKGMVRHVLRLPKQTDESSFKVEIIVGKTVRLDAANNYFLAARLKPKTSRAGVIPATYLISSGQWRAR